MMAGGALMVMVAFFARKWLLPLIMPKSASRPKVKAQTQNHVDGVNGVPPGRLPPLPSTAIKISKVKEQKEKAIIEKVSRDTLLSGKLTAQTHCIARRVSAGNDEAKSPKESRADPGSDGQTIVHRPMNSCQ
jgi:hypothetical protein